MTSTATASETSAEHRLAVAVEELGRLPVLSATVRRVQAIAESEDAGIGDMVAALEADQGLATDLLRYANSAACARPLRARSIRAAVTLVGRKAIAQLAIEAATYRFFQAAPGNGGRSIGHLHLHAAAVAGCSQSIAERTGAGIEMVAAVLFASASDLSIERLVEEGNGLRARDLLERQAINRLRAQVFESHRGIVTRIVKEKMSWSDWREKNQARANSVMEAMDTILASRPFDIARYAVAQGTLADLAQR